MKKMKTIVASAFAVTMLASCGGGSKTIDPNAHAENYKDNLEGKISLEFKANYKTDIKNGNESSDQFKRDMKETTVAEIDLTAGDLYLHIKKDSKNFSDESSKEALVYKDGEDYFYLTKFHKDPIKLANEEAALAQIRDTIKKISYTNINGIELDTLKFSNDGSYENHNFLADLGDDAYGIQEIKEAQKFSKGENGSLVLNEELAYAAYKTDQAMSRFGKEDGDKTPAQTLEVNVNKDGYVTSFTNNINCANVLHLSATFNPTTLVTGTKTLSATYDATFEKLTTIEHQETAAKLEIGNGNKKGSIQVMVTPDLALGFPALRPVKGIADVKVGETILLKQTPVEGNTLLAVIYNGNSLAKPNITIPGAGDFFMFTVEEGKTKIDVNYSGDNVLQPVVASIATTKPEGVTVQYLVCEPGDYGHMKPVTDLSKVDGSLELNIKVTAPEGKTIKVVMNGDERPQNFGFYSKRLVAGENTIVITFVE